MWARNAANFPNAARTWQDALDYINSVNNGGGLGGHHDWRLPNRKELFSLVDHSRYNPALPVGYPFQNVQSSDYWSSTTYALVTYMAWYVNMWDGSVDSYHHWKSDTNYFWPVRGGF